MFLFKSDVDRFIQTFLVFDQLFCLGSLPQRRFLITRRKLISARLRPAVGGAAKNRSENVAQVSSCFLQDCQGFQNQFLGFIKEQIVSRVLEPDQVFPHRSIQILEVLFSQFSRTIIVKPANEEVDRYLYRRDALEEIKCHHWRPQLP